MTKLQDASSRINRAIAKTVTSCGCLNIDAKKQDIPDDVGYSEVAAYVKSHLEGELCPNCAEVLETELGKALFYITAICCLLDLDLEKVMDRENDRINTLGAFSLT